MSVHLKQCSDGPGNTTYRIELTTNLHLHARTASTRLGED